VTFFFENRAVSEKMWKNSAEPEKPQMTVWCMRIACWVTKATKTRNVYYLLFFQGNNGYTNAHHCRGMGALPLLVYPEGSKETQTEYNRKKEAGSPHLST